MNLVSPIKSTLSSSVFYSISNFDLQYEIIKRNLQTVVISVCRWDLSDSNRTHSGNHSTNYVNRSNFCVSTGLVSFWKKLFYVISDIIALLDIIFDPFHVLIFIKTRITQNKYLSNAVPVTVWSKVKSRHHTSGAPETWDTFPQLRAFLTHSEYHSIWEQFFETRWRYRWILLGRCSAHSAVGHPSARIRSRRPDQGTCACPNPRSSRNNVSSLRLMNAPGYPWYREASWRNPPGIMEVQQSLVNIRRPLFCLTFSLWKRVGTPISEE